MVVLSVLVTACHSNMNLLFLRFILIVSCQFSFQRCAAACRYLHSHGVPYAVSLPVDDDHLVLFRPSVELFLGTFAHPFEQHLIFLPHGFSIRWADISFCRAMSSFRRLTFTSSLTSSGRWRLA